MTALRSFVKLFIFLLIVCYSVTYCSASCIFPSLHIEAFNQSGLRISFPIDSSIEKYSANFRVSYKHSTDNQWLRFNIDVPKNTKTELISKDDISNRWIYLNPDLKVNVGDYIWYRMEIKNVAIAITCVQPYRIYKIREFGSENDILPKVNDCISSETIVNGATTCRNTLLFEDEFRSDKLNVDKWQSEQYIPLRGPNFEFNYYSHDAVHLNLGTLQITPQPKHNEAEVRGILNLNPGCTSSDISECEYTHQGAQYLAPIKSGKVKSKFSFKYGQIEIEAKLPRGDWILPEITLTPLDSNDLSKIYIAYAKGNKQLTGNGSDSGVLYSGYSEGPTEPIRSLHLSSTKPDSLLTDTFFKFTIIWTPDQIISYIGGTEYGEKAHYMNSECNICLGIAVGGINDFPDGISSQGEGKYIYAKPWRNKDVRQVKDFFTARNLWLPSWSNGISKRLVVESVRVYAL